LLFDLFFAVRTFIYLFGAFLLFFASVKSCGFLASAVLFVLLGKVHVVVLAHQAVSDLADKPDAVNVIV
jgi:hypothetical protein